MPADRRGTTQSSLQDQERNNAPMVAVFGGVFALFLVLFLLINIFSQANLEERLGTASSDEGLYRIGWGSSGEGYVVIAFPGELRIVETAEVIAEKEICSPGGAFSRYVTKLYAQKKKQLIFALTEGSVRTMATARNCMLQVMPGKLLTVGWIVANDELLKSVSLDDIPPYIKKVIE